MATVTETGPEVVQQLIEENRELKLQLQQSTQENNELQMKLQSCDKNLHGRKMLDLYWINISCYIICIYVQG